MPRSFLVKKIKLDDFSSSNVVHHQHLDDSFTFARSITDSVTSLGVRLSENGELTCLQLQTTVPVNSPAADFSSFRYFQTDGVLFCFVLFVEMFFHESAEKSLIV